MYSQAHSIMRTYCSDCLLMSKPRNIESLSAIVAIFFSRQRVSMTSKLILSETCQCRSSWGCVLSTLWVCPQLSHAYFLCVQLTILTVFSQYTASAPMYLLYTAYLHSWSISSAFNALIAKNWSHWPSALVSELCLCHSRRWWLAVFSSQRRQRHRALQAFHIQAVGRRRASWHCLSSHRGKLAHCVFGINSLTYCQTPGRP